MSRALLLSGLFCLAGCGGSASETPFPPEPMDVNLEAEDLAPQPDPYKAARPDETKARETVPEEEPKAKPAPSAPAPR